MAKVKWIRSWSRVWQYLSRWLTISSLTQMCELVHRAPLVESLEYLCYSMYVLHILVACELVTCHVWLVLISHFSQPRSRAPEAPQISNPFILSRCHCQIVFSCLSAPYLCRWVINKLHNCVLTWFIILSVNDGCYNIFSVSVFILILNEMILV